MLEIEKKNYPWLYKEECIFLPLLPYPQSFIPKCSGRSNRTEISVFRYIFIYYQFFAILMIFRSGVRDKEKNPEIRLAG